MTDADDNLHSTEPQRPPWKNRKILVVAAALLVVALIFGVSTNWKFGNSEPAISSPDGSASETNNEEEAEGVAPVEESESVVGEENSQGLSAETVENLAEASTDGDGLIDFIQYNRAESNYTVVVRNTSGVDDTYSVTVLVAGEPVGAQGVEVPAASTATTTVDVILPRGTTEVNVRLDGTILGEGIVEVLHQN